MYRLTSGASILDSLWGIFHGVQKEFGCYGSRPERAQSLQEAKDCSVILMERRGSMGDLRSAAISI